MKFNSQFQIDRIAAVPYNPRSISSEAFIELKKSLQTLGVVKPLIVNSNGNIVAGHQRSRALKELGFNTVPVFQSEIPISPDQEVRFNLVHNTLEADKASVKIRRTGLPFRQFVQLPYEDIILRERGYMSYVTEYCKLISKYGDCGSIVVNESGNVIHNGEYAYACFLLRRPCLAYAIEKDALDSFSAFMSKDYGDYDFSRIKTHNYSQSYAQLNRKEGYDESFLYKKKVYPYVRHNQKILDFGAGNGYSVRSLMAQGFNALEYEPFRKKKGSNAIIDLSSVQHMIATLTSSVQQSGLFDVLISDHVLNSVKDDEWQDYVMTAMNALVKEDGVLYLATRGRGKDEQTRRARIAADKGIMSKAAFQYLDKQGYSLTYLNRVWFKQKYYRLDELRTFLLNYFEMVEAYETGPLIMAECRYKKKLGADRLRTALNKEFNIEYPGALYLNVQANLVKEVLLRN